MKHLCVKFGVCLLAAGIGIIFSMFLPDKLLVVIEAFLLILAGLLILKKK